MQDLSWLFIAFFILWFVGILGIYMWVAKRVIPELRKEMEEYGLNENQQTLLIMRAMFPPKFHK